MEKPSRNLGSQHSLFGSANGGRVSSSQAEVSAREQASRRKLELPVIGHVGLSFLNTPTWTRGFAMRLNHTSWKKTLSIPIHLRHWSLSRTLSRKVVSVPYTEIKGNGTEQSQGNRNTFTHSQTRRKNTYREQKPHCYELACTSNASLALLGEITPAPCMLPPSMTPKFGLKPLSIITEARPTKALI